MSVWVHKPQKGITCEEGDEYAIEIRLKEGFDLGAYTIVYTKPVVPPSMCRWPLQLNQCSRSRAQLLILQSSYMGFYLHS